jgi:predicted transcriptional regulator
MTKTIEALLERVTGWPEEAQAELLASVLEIEARHGIVHRLSDDERNAVRRGLAELRAGKLATPEQVEAVFARYRA